MIREFKERTRIKTRLVEAFLAARKEAASKDPGTPSTNLGYHQNDHNLRGKRERSSGYCFAQPFGV